MRLGVLPLARPTFDMGAAQAKLRAMIKKLGGCGVEILGSCELLLDDESAANERNKITARNPDIWVVLQTSFTDATVVTETAECSDLPMMIWAVREPRSGGRLLLNSLCGLNLAAHALGLRGRKFSWIYNDPEFVDTDHLNALLSGVAENTTEVSSTPATENVAGRKLADSLRGVCIGQFGRHPPGFDTCTFDSETLDRIFGIEIKPLTLDDLFDVAKKLGPAQAGDAGGITLHGLGDVEQGAVDLSFRLAPALRQLAHGYGLDAIAVRCWPECFTEYGGAVCGPVSMLAEEMLPCACESDVYGAISLLTAQRAAAAPVFLADLVDADQQDDTAVVWHCGQAPLSMCDRIYEPLAAVHSNRRLPLLCQFPLKPGRVTLSRISKARGVHRIVVAAGEMLRRPLAFAGTAGVLRFDRPVQVVLADIIDGGLEHHFVVAYGDIRPQLRGFAAALGFEVMEL